MPNGAGDFGNRVASQAGNTAASLKALGNTVAQIFEGRSPGERLAGALASLKPRRNAAIHERALPKVRRPAAAVMPPVVPPAAAPVAATPLYNIVNGTPVVPPSVAAPPPGGGPPVVFPGSPGGGGGIIFPPIVSQPPPVNPPPVTPPPVTPPVVTPPVIPPGTPPGVPEPASWAMMLIGFAAIGSVIRHQRAKFPQAT